MTGLRTQLLVSCPVFKSHNYHCVTMDKSLKLSRCQYSHLSNEDNDIYIS